MNSFQTCVYKDQFSHILVNFKSQITLLPEINRKFCKDLVQVNNASISRGSNNKSNFYPSGHGTFEELLISLIEPITNKTFYNIFQRF